MKLGMMLAMLGDKHSKHSLIVDWMKKNSRYESSPIKAGDSWFAISRHRTAGNFPPWYDRRAGTGEDLRKNDGICQRKFIYLYHPNISKVNAFSKRSEGWNFETWKWAFHHRADKNGNPDGLPSRSQWSCLRKTRCLMMFCYLVTWLPSGELT